MTWHNQVTILKQSIVALNTVVGQGLINALKPALRGMNAFLSGTIDFAQKTVNALGKIFGWRYEVTGGGVVNDMFDDLEDVSDSLGLGDVEDDADGIADALSGATDAANEFKATIMGFDELNVLNGLEDAVKSSTGKNGKDSKDKDGETALSGIGDGFSDLDGHLVKTLSLFDSDINNLYELGKFMSDTVKDLLNGIKWDEAYEKARKFGAGLAEFLNGINQPDAFRAVGKTIANSLNTIAEAVNSFTVKYDWKNAGDAFNAGLLGLFQNVNWELMKKTAGNLGHGIAGLLNHLFTPELFSEAGKAFGESLNTAFRFLDTFGHEFNFSNFGNSIASGVNSACGTIEWSEALSAAKTWGAGISNAINEFFKETSWEDVGHTLAGFIKTGIKTFFSVTSNLEWEDIGTDIATAINTFLDGLDADDLADGINGIINGLNSAIDKLKEEGTFDKIGHKFFGVLARLDWGGIAKLHMRGTLLDTSIAIATALGDGLTSNPVKTILGGSVGIMKDALTLYIGAKIAGGLLGVGGTAAAASGSAAAAAGAAGTTIAGSLAAGLAVGAPLIGIALAMIHANLTDSWDKTELNQAYSYQRMHDQTRSFVDVEVSQTESGADSIVKTYDGMGREIGVLVSGSTSENKKTFWEYWNDTTDGVKEWSKTHQDTVTKLFADVKSDLSTWSADVKSGFKETWETTKADTSERIDRILEKITGFIGEAKSKLGEWKESIVGFFQNAWGDSEVISYNSLNNIQTNASSSLWNVQNTANTSLSNLPTIFDNYFGQSEDSAVGHMNNIFDNTASTVNGVISWVDTAMNALADLGSASYRPTIYHGSGWPGYASGGFPESAEIFTAREGGRPEMVGRIGTRTAVANNDQIVEAIRAGVMDGFMTAMVSTGSRGQSEQLVNEIKIVCGEETLYRATLRGREKYNRRFQTVATM